MIIKLIASIKEKLGKDQIIIENDSLKNIDDVITYFNENFDIDISNCMFAADLEYVDKNYNVKSVQEISVIPPVSGGSNNDLIEITDRKIFPF